MAWGKGYATNISRQEGKVYLGVGGGMIAAKIYFDSYEKKPIGKGGRREDQSAYRKRGKTIKNSIQGHNRGNQDVDRWGMNFKVLALAKAQLRKVFRLLGRGPWYRASKTLMEIKKHQKNPGLNKSLQHSPKRLHCR